MKNIRKYEVLALIELHQKGIKPYKMSKCTHKHDCRRARKYYTEQGINMKGYHAHHSVDGYVYPIKCEIHLHIHHYGPYAHQA